MNNQIGQTIARLRRQAGFSQEKLAIRADVSRQTVYRWEAGILIPASDNLKRLAEVFQVDVNVFFAPQESDLLSSDRVEDKTRKANSVSDETEVKKSETEICVSDGLGQAISRCDREEVPTCKRAPRSRRKIVLFWTAFVLSVLAAGAAIVLLAFMTFVPAEGDTHAHSVAWGLSSGTAAALISVGAAVVILFIVMAASRFLKNRKQ